MPTTVRADMMSSLLRYKDYFGSVEYSPEDRVLWGKIEFINDLVTFEAANVDGLEREFREAVDHYIETCRNLGRKPQKPFKGRFNVRIQPELHRKASIKALQRKISLNKFVEDAIKNEVSRE